MAEGPQNRVCVCVGGGDWEAAGGGWGRASRPAAQIQLSHTRGRAKDSQARRDSQPWEPMPQVPHVEIAADSHTTDLTWLVSRPTALNKPLEGRLAHSQYSQVPPRAAQILKNGGKKTQDHKEKNC